ncbi:ankyrin repeat domain-containing protein [Mesorhizobium australicum]|uniref:Ankyrin repeat-containing protein n=1 Tax=Mesorhizobium australicum TaxID=536018 RepID=A0A1X7PXF9_9HYPH|nr:ankyrin repeat domain-containing protein [Mesorhizobium australicum]SMH57017.1 hypothetical protein SAMN02982922_5659 [Mesorhizobium australicum]
MKRLPDHPNLDQLKKQAKDLLSGYRRNDPDALARFRDALPLAAGRDDAAIAALGLRLHDAQSCIAREYGFASWTELGTYVAARRAFSTDRATLVLNWLRLVYPGDIAGGTSRASPAAAARLLEDQPELTAGDPWLACAIGDTVAIAAAVNRDPGWVNRPGGQLNLPPLVAVTHSGLVRLPAYRDRLHAAAKLLLDAGADPDQSVWSRWPPASLAEPSTEHRLSALYGAAGQNRDPQMTRLLLDAGADPNDNESLYHSLESPDVTRLLLAAGARIEGTNANYRVFDLDNLESLRVLIDFGKREQPPIDWSLPLLFAIRRGRSVAHVEALLAAGADPRVRSRDDTSAYGLALRYGLTDVADLLRRETGAEPLSEEESFVAACAAGDEDEARRIQAGRPDLPASLPEARLKMLPELAANGRDAAVRAMVRVGWPIEVKGGDWGASALNLAVFRGDAGLARFLLEQGADWRSQHGFGDNVCGTLSWASNNEPEPDGDWLGCAEALVAHGMPRGEPDPEGSGDVVIDGKRRRFSDDVAEFLLSRT